MSGSLSDLRGIWVTGASERPRRSGAGQHMATADLENDFDIAQYENDLSFARSFRRPVGKTYDFPCAWIANAGEGSARQYVDLTFATGRIDR